MDTFLKRHWSTLSPAGHPFPRGLGVIAFFSLGCCASLFFYLECCKLCCIFTFFYLFFQFHRRIYKGIPLQFRGQVWSLLLDVPKMKEEMKDFYSVSL